MLVYQNVKSDFHLISGLRLRFQSDRKKLYFKYLYILKKVARLTIHEGLRKGTVKLLVCQHYHHPSQGDLKQHEPLVKKIAWGRDWLPTPVFLSGKSHGQRSLQATVHGFAEIGCDWATNTTHTHTKSCWECSKVR